MTCNLCGGPLEPWLDMAVDPKKREKTPYANALRCRDCGLGVVDPLPDVDEIAGFYRLDEYYTHGQSHFAAGEKETLLDRLRIHLAWRADRGREFDAEMLLAHMERPASELSLLDMGCGGGDNLRRLQSAGFQLAGLDPDPEAIALLRQSGIEGHLGPAEAVPDSLSGRQFDIVIMTHALEHCLDPQAALRTAWSLTKPQGIFLCETPNSACGHFEMFNVISEMYDAPRHLYFFSPDNLKQSLEKVGFEVIEEYFGGYVRHFANDWRATENRIRDAMIEHGAPIETVPPAHSRWQSMKLFIKSALAAPAAKYDCVGFVAKKANPL